MSGAKLLIFSSADSNIRYATGLNISSQMVYAAFGSKEYVLVNRMEFTLAKKQAKKGVNVLCWDTINLDNIRKIPQRKQNLADVAASFLLSYNVSDVFIPENMWNLHVETLREHNIRARMKTPFFAKRPIKTAQEIGYIKKAGLATKNAMKRAVDIIKESTVQWDDSLLWHNQKITSEFLKNEIARVLLLDDCVCEDVIVSCGEQAFEAHNRGHGELKAGQTILIDIFPRHKESGYHFDMTRTIIKGTPSKELKRMYQTVIRAQKEVLDVLAPGSAKQLHLAAVDVFDRAGYKSEEGEGFPYSLGHGVGLDIHERPRIGKKSDDILEAGQVITIEPGLHYPELGGVRIEDTVLVTKDGYTNLTNFPRNLILQ